MTNNLKPTLRLVACNPITLANQESWEDFNARRLANMKKRGFVKAAENFEETLRATMQATNQMDAK